MAPGTHQATVRVLNDPEILSVLGHPLRVQILEALRDPGSAAAVARTVRQPRQKVNYHLKELERAGLVQPTGDVSVAIRRRAPMMRTAIATRRASSDVRTCYKRWLRLDAQFLRHARSAIVNDAPGRYTASCHKRATSGSTVPRIDLFMRHSDDAT